MSGGRVLIKICGLGKPGDLRAAAGADMIGAVVGIPTSPRNRTWEEAREIFSAARGEFLSVAVLADPSSALVREAFGAKADLVQVHGKVPAGLSRDEKRRVIPSIPIPRPAMDGGRSQDDLSPLIPEGEEYPFVHLDVASGQGQGGTGLTSDWAICHRLVRNHPSTRFIFGGGLTPMNVVGAIRDVCPAGVDVSTGVESAPGVKSPEKVSHFIQAVRRWEGRHA